MHAARALVVILVAALGACPKDAPPSTPTAPPGPAPVAPRIEGPTGELLDAYEGTRARLAADDWAGAKAFVDKMSAAARAGGADAAKKPAFDAVVDGTAKMAAAGDIKAARLAFGDVSKAVITMLVADPALRTGRFLMMCPMAPGYQRWVQTSSKLTNPYFGSEMLECGETLKDWNV
jgi:Cu(I)/Ag(I) efflux system membrane fusion protein